MYYNRNARSIVESAHRKDPIKYKHRCYNFVDNLVTFKTEATRCSSITLHIKLRKGITLKVVIYYFFKMPIPFPLPFPLPFPFLLPT